MKGFAMARRATDNTINSLLSNFNDNRSFQQPHPDFVGLSGDTDTSNHVAEQAALSQMSTSDLHGMAGFLATINNEDPLVRGLAKGIDLSTLGLSLNSAEYYNQPQFEAKITDD